MKSDYKESVTERDIARAAVNAGVGLGDTVFLHSSLSSMVRVQGGAQAVINGFLSAAGAGGTLAAPSNWWKWGLKIEEWNPETSPAWTGIIPETMRLMPGSFRSDNPTHSVVAVGRRAGELTLTHGRRGARLCIFGEKAFAQDSPWEKLYRWNAACCFLGVGFKANTMGHYVQCLLVERCLEAAPPRRRERLQREIRAFDKKSVWPRYDFNRMGGFIERAGLVKLAKTGPAVLRCARAAEMADFILKEIEARPGEWLDEEFLNWMARTRGKFIRGA